MVEFAEVWKEPRRLMMAQAQQKQLPEHMQNTPSAVVQVAAGLIFAVFLAALIWASVKYLPRLWT